MSEYNRLPATSALATFEAAFRLHSFTRAADELSLSQASVSRRIRELEESLGVSLFERRRHDVVPTGEAEEFATTARLVLHELSATVRRLRSRGSGSRVTVHSDLGLTAALIAPVIGDFQRQHPEVHLQVLASYESIEDVRETFDFGLQYGRFGEERFHTEPIAGEAIFPVCSPEMAARLQSSTGPTGSTGSAGSAGSTGPTRPIGPVEVASAPLLHLADPGRGWPDWRAFLALFRVKEPAPDQRLVFSSYQICLDVAERGEGIALGWARTARARIDAGTLVRIPGMTMMLPDSIYLHVPRGRELSANAGSFLEMLRGRIRPVG